MDGVKHFSSTKVHCPSCITRTHRNGEVSYHHAGLAAVVVHPAQSEVFPLDFEPILREDGAQWLNESAPDLKVNFLLYEQTTPDGEVKRWTWVTNLTLLAGTVARVMRAGRSRWKIENETFNTLKNQGYHFEHNYGHGQQHLATVLAILMMLAFLVDQIQQRRCQLFRQLWKGLGTKSKLWASMRNLFSVLIFNSMEALYRHMASLYRLQIE